MNPKGSSILGNLHLKKSKKNFFIADISKTSVSDTKADENDAYLKSRHTKKFCYCDKDRNNIAREHISDKFYYNERLSPNSYKNVYIPSDINLAPNFPIN